MPAPPTGNGDIRVASFTWTPSTGELRSCTALPSLLGLDTGDERPLLTRVLDRLSGEDVDRLHGAVRTARSTGGAQSVELELAGRGGGVRHLTATAAPAHSAGGESVVGVVHDITRFRHVEHALEARHAVTAALANWEVLGFDGLLGPLGSALGADSATVWAARRAGLRALAEWRPDGEDTLKTSAPPSDVVVRASQVGLPVAGAAGGADAELAVGPAAGNREALAFPVVTLSGVLLVIEVRARGGLWVSDTLTRLLGAVGRELGAFFAARPCPPDGLDLSPREREVLELVAEGLSAPEIAGRLVLSPSTVRSHIRNVYGKLDVGDRVSAVVKAMRAGVIR